MNRPWLQGIAAAAAAMLTAAVAAGAVIYGWELIVLAWTCVLWVFIARGRR